MKLDKKGLFSLLLGAFLLANVLELLHVNLLYTTTLISFCIYILLPGFLISLILRIRKLSLWENILLIVGFGIAFLEFGGLLLNTILPLIRINNPLAFLNLLAGFDVYLILLFILAWVRTKQFSMQIRLRRRSKIEKAFYTLPPFFPVLAALGAIILNNGGSNVLTLVLLGAIGFYVLLLVIFHKKVSSDLYPYAIFFIGLACLLTTSLRSWYISGPDIKKEFVVFQLTNMHHIWQMSSFQDAYNACLSIAILPTILTNLLSIQDIYVYKVIFQVLFATSAVLVFLISKKYTKPVFAFLAALFFLSFPTFLIDMPMANRQEIAFIFFGLVLYMMLCSDLLSWTRKFVFIIFALSIAVSHYSTYFTFLALILSVYILTRLCSLSFLKKTFTSLMIKYQIKFKNTFNNQKILTFPILFMLFLMTFSWYNLYTNTSNSIGSVISSVVNNISLMSDPNSRNLPDIFFFLSDKDPNELLQNYIQYQENSNKANASDFYSKAITSKYNSHVVPQEQLAPTPLGNALATLRLPVLNIQSVLRSLFAACMQIFLFIGLLSFLAFKRLKHHAPKFGIHTISPEHNNSVDLQFLFLCLGALFMLAVMVILPILSVSYGVSRMYLQFLFVLSLPIVLGVSSLLFFMKEQKRILITGIIAIIFFLGLSGFIPHLTGDYYPQYNLDNSGLYYDAYYVHKSDVLAVNWLSTIYNNDPVMADVSGLNNLRTYGNIYASNNIFPSLITKNAYVYLNNSDNIVVIFYDRLFIVNSPKPFLDSNKNCIYNNGEISIYK